MNKSFTFNAYKLDSCILWRWLQKTKKKRKWKNDGNDLGSCLWLHLIVEIKWDFLNIFFWNHLKEFLLIYKTIPSSPSPPPPCLWCGLHVFMFVNECSFHWWCLLMQLEVCLQILKGDYNENVNIALFYENFLTRKLSFNVIQFCIGYATIFFFSEILKNRNLTSSSFY